MVKTHILKNSFNLKSLSNIQEKFTKFISEKNKDNLIDYAILLEEFLIQFLQLPIKKYKPHKQKNNIYYARRHFVEKIAKEENIIILEDNIENYLDENILANKIINEEDLTEIKEYTINILFNPKYEEYKRNSVLFNIPQKLDYQNLLNNTKINTIENNFDFNFHWEKNKTAAHSDINISYCLKCHIREKDSCRTGSKTHNGCPLKQHISESILLKEQGHLLASLAVMMINNPLLAMTGYRICNDCVKSCIFTKQTPVDIPCIETNIFDEILHLPYGLEIYLLLTQWNPLNFEQPLPLAKSHNNVLVVGLGPAGIAMSYYLLRLGFNVVAIEANKIEKMHISKYPVKNWTTINLEDRETSGFGGVAEYGITSRWNKNYLSIMRLLLEKQSSFKYFDGIRFGSNYTGQEALKNFNHIVIAAGAGLQTIPKEINLAKNIRLAGDFLMTLQLGGAYKKNPRNLAINLQIQLPAIVIGGGLTAIDTATEILSYYPRQILKILENYEALTNLTNLTNEEEVLLNKFLKQARDIKQMISQQEIYNYLESLGGVKILYRNELNKCSAYKINHEELDSALKKGIKFITNIEIINIDEIGGEVVGVNTNQGYFPAKSLFIAYGVSFNFNFLKETRLFNDADIINFYESNSKSSLITERVSIIGDMNPHYKGSVVKAITNASHASKEIKFSNIKYKKIPNLIARIYSTRKISCDEQEFIIHSPSLVKKISIGEFFKIQNYSDGKNLLSEPVAITPIYLDYKKNLIYFILKKRGASTKILSQLKKNEKIIIMGPVGDKFDLTIFKDKKILFVCEDFRHYLTLFLLEAISGGSEILYLSNGNIDSFYRKKIQKLCDIVECNLIEKIKENIDKYDYLIMGAKNTTIKNLIYSLNEKIKIIDLTNAPMQCMMKGVCSQCIEKDKNGNFIYKCASSRYKLYNVKDSKNIRLSQNSLLEKISNLLIL